MRPIRLAAALFLTGVCGSVLLGQDGNQANQPVAPPNLLLLVRQEVPPARANEREKLEVSMSRACDRLDAPSFWINLRSLSGSRESLFFDPFESFEHWEQSRAAWSEFYAAHPDLSRLQEEIDELIGSEHTIFAVRRRDLGYLTDSIDLSETRFMRTIEVHLFPGRENDFVESLKILADAHAKIQADTPWEVYQVNVGAASPTFLIFMPLFKLAKNDDLLSWEQELENAEGDASAERLKQIAHDSFSSAETTLYEVRPEMSHVSREFAGSDPEFWRHAKPTDAMPDRKPYVKPSKKGAYEKLPSR